METEKDTWGWGVYCFTVQFLLRKMRNSGLECGDGYTTLEMYVTPRNGTLNATELHT